MKHSFTVKRSNWLRGERDSYLLHPENGKMCCVGFLCESLEITKGDMLDRVHLSEVMGPREEVAGFFQEEYYGASRYIPETGLAERIYGTNDNSFLTDLQREAMLTELFEQAGIEIKFED